jgi:hypothetical protein
MTTPKAKTSTAVVISEPAGAAGKSQGRAWGHKWHAGEAHRCKQHVGWPGPAAKRAACRLQPTPQEHLWGQVRHGAWGRGRRAVSGVSQPRSGGLGGWLRLGAVTNGCVHHACARSCTRQLACTGLSMHTTHTHTHTHTHRVHWFEHAHTTNRQAPQTDKLTRSCEPSHKHGHANSTTPRSPL